MCGGSFWVCEKSDGQRVLMLIVLNKKDGRQEVYLIDRKNNYRLQHPSIFFPYQEIPVSDATANRLQDMRIAGDRYGVRTDTLLDGELVWDEEPDGRVSHFVEYPRLKADKRLMYYRGNCDFCFLIASCLMESAWLIDHLTNDMGLVIITLKAIVNLLTIKFLQRLSTMVIPPFQQFMRETPAAAADAPFEYA